MRHDELLGAASSTLQALRRAMGDIEVAGDASDARACVDAQVAVIEGLRLRQVRPHALACTHAAPRAMWHTCTQPVQQMWLKRLPMCA